MKTALLVLALSTVAFAKVHIVDQKNSEFSVKKLDVKIGDSILFKNSETAQDHNVYSTSAGNSFSTPLVGPGKTTEIKIEAPAHKAGKMEVKCAIHPAMKLEVNIKP
jgi:plastocyanin